MSISPFCKIAGHKHRRIVLVCDHASAYIPPDLGALGLGADELSSHIAWDIGAAAVTGILAERLMATAILAGASRLVVDCNRPPESSGWMPAESCGIVIPGNRGLSADQVARRAETWYDPYHRAVAETCQDRDDPCVVAIHSFTPVMDGTARPWQVGILWNRDGRLAEPLMENLRKSGEVDVGDNLPYSGQTLNYTLDRHADARGLPHVSIELRQDLLADDVGVRHWADLVLTALTPILTQLGL